MKKKCCRKIPHQKICVGTCEAVLHSPNLTGNTACTMASNTKTALCASLARIDEQLKNDVVVIFYGGTALTVLESKLVSEDIDIIVPMKN